MFNFAEELPDCFLKQQECTIFCSYQQHASMQGCSTSLSTLVIICLFIVAIRVGVKWCFIVVLICISLMVHVVKHFFSCAYWTFVCLLWRNIFSGPLSIFIRLLILLLLSVKSSSHILDTSPSADRWFAKMCSPSLSFFTFLRCPLKKFSILMKSSLLFSFVACTLCVISKKLSPNLFF